MTNGEFREWLRGFFELSADDASLNLKQIQVIVNHLNLAEAVEGSLDKENLGLRAAFEAVRSRPSPGPGQLAALTQDIRHKLL